MEGAGQGGTGANWGDGFSTAASVINPGGASDPTRFFKTLLTKPYRWVTHFAMMSLQPHHPLLQDPAHQAQPVKH